MLRYGPEEDDARMPLSRLLRNSERARFLRGAFWSVTGSGVAQGSMLAAFAVVARLLGPAAIGELGLVQSTVGMLGDFGGIGLGLTATRYVAEYSKTDTAKAGRIAGLAIAASVLCTTIVAVLLWLAAPYLAAETIAAPHLMPVLRVSCGLLLFNTIAGVQAGVLAGLEAFPLLAKTNAIRGVLVFPGMIVGVWFYGVLGAVAGMALAACFGCIVAHIALRRALAAAGIPLSYRASSDEFRVLWTLSVPSFLCGAIASPVNWAARAFLANQPGGYTQIGLYTGATRLQDAISMGAELLGSAFLPMLASRQRGAEDGLARANILVPWCIGIAFALPLITYPGLLGLLLGSEFGSAPARQTLVLVMIATCIRTYRQGLSRAFATRELMWWAAGSNVTWGVVVLASMSWLRHFGGPGLAGAVAGGYAISTVAFFPVYLKKRLVPRRLVLSLEAAIVWAAVGGLACLSLSASGQLVLFLAFVLAALAASTALYRLGRSQVFPWNA